jgi:ABC-type nitrate/sulfonate/bicarbonate transport system substrate-binding protein
MNLTKLRLIQFRAGYNLPVHAGRAKGIFERHGLDIEVIYTPGSLYICEALRKGEFEIGHTGADDIIADVEHSGGGPGGLFIFMGLHSGLLSIIGAPGKTNCGFASRPGTGGRCASERFCFCLGKTPAF